MRFAAVRRAERYLGLAVLAGVSSAAGAQETQTAVVVSTGASVETNPYNTLNSGGASIAGTAEIRPLMRWRGESTTIDLASYAQFRQFLEQYGLEDNYGVNGNITSRVAERITVRSNAAFSYSQGGYNDFGRAGLLPGIPTAPGTVPDLPDPAVIDPTLLGTRARTKGLSIGAGASTQLSAYSSASVDLFGQMTRVDQVGFGDFNTVGGQASYSYQLSESTSIGVIGSGSKTDYRGTTVGDARTASISGSLDRRIGERWTLFVSAGLANTRSNVLPGLPDDKFSSFTTQIRTCNQGERGRFCLAGSRSPEPSANGNVRVNTSLQSDYSYRLSERETATVSGSYARTGGGRSLTTVLAASEFVSGAVRYDKQIRDNLSLYTSTNFSKVYSSDLPRKANFGVTAGIQYRFGALQ